MSAIQVNVHIVMLEELPASPEHELTARITIIRDTNDGEIRSSSTPADPEQKQ